MSQGRLSPAHRIGLGFILLTFLAIAISSFILKKDFDERSQKSSMLVARLMTSTINQHRERLTPGLEALKAEAAEPGQSFELISKVDAFARRYGLEQASLYRKLPDQKDLALLSIIMPRENQIHIFADRQKKRPRLRFPYAFLGLNKSASLLRSEGRLYLDMNFPLHATGEKTAFTVVRATMPLPDSFLAKMEQETGLRISFYSPKQKYLAGILEPNLDIPSLGSFNNQGIDGVEYINYPSTAQLDGSEFAKIILSFEKKLLMQRIWSMIFIILGVNAFTMGMLWIMAQLHKRRQTSAVL